MQTFDVGDLVKYDGPAGIFLAEVTSRLAVGWAYKGEIIRVVSNEKRYTQEDIEYIRMFGGDPESTLRVGQPVALVSDTPYSDTDRTGISVLVARAGQWTGNELPQ